jgi:hypothetical protein
MCFTLIPLTENPHPKIFKSQVSDLLKWWSCFWKPHWTTICDIIRLRISSAGLLQSNHIKTSRATTWDMLQGVARCGKHYQQSPGPGILCKRSKWPMNMMTSKTSSNDCSLSHAISKVSHFCVWPFPHPLNNSRGTAMPSKMTLAQLEWWAPVMMRITTWLKPTTSLREILRIRDHWKTYWMRWEAVWSLILIKRNTSKRIQKGIIIYTYIYIYISHPNLNRVIHQSCPETVCKHSEATNFILFCNACNACRNVCRYVYPSYRHSLWISSWSDWVCLNMGYTEYTIGETP